MRTKSLFEPGDVVECITETGPCCNIDEKDVPQPKLRKVYRVAEINDGQCDVCGYIAPCFQTADLLGNRTVWPQEMFRKIRPSSEDIFKLAKVKEPA